MSVGIFELRKRITTDIDGLSYIKTISVGIPYAKIQLNVTIRKEIAIPLSHEIVLKLISEKWTHYDQIRKILGLDQDYMDNVVSELGFSDYITHIGKQLSLTHLGRKVLNELKSVKIEPDLMENIFVNLLDGSILNGEYNKHDFRDKVNCDVFLTKIVELEGNFLIEHESEIRDLYQERNLAERQSFSGYAAEIMLRDDLYRVIGMQHFDIVYKEVEAEVYRSEDDSINYIFNSGNVKNDELYNTVFRTQIKVHQKSFERMYDTRYYNANKNYFSNKIIPFSENEYELLSNSRQDLKLLLTSHNIKNDTIHANYYSNRLLFFREYQDIFSNLINQIPREVILLSDHYYDLQKTEYSLLKTLEAISSNSSVYIGYMLKDSGTQSFIKNIRNLNNKNIHLKETTDIRNTTIIVDKNFMIKVYYKPVILGKEIMFEEIGVLTIDKDTIEFEYNKLKNLF